MTKKSLLAIGGTILAVALMGQGCPTSDQVKSGAITPPPFMDSNANGPRPTPPPTFLDPNAPRPFEQTTDEPATTVSKSSLNITHTVGISPCPTPIDSINIVGRAEGTFKITGTPDWLTLSSDSGKLNSGGIGASGARSVNLSFNCKITNYATHVESATLTVEAFDTTGKSTGKVDVKVQVNVVGKAK